MASLPCHAQSGSVMHHQPRTIDASEHVGQTEGDALVFGEWVYQTVCVRGRNRGLLQKRRGRCRY